MTTPDNTLYPSPQWTLFIDNGHLFASAGADEVYLLDDLDAAQATRLLDSWQSGGFEALSQESEVFSKAISQLLEAGALFRGRTEPSQHLTLALHWCGDPLPDWRTSLMEQPGAAKWAWATGDENANLALIVRTNATLAQAAELAAPLEMPHLLVDMANHHTFSIGPLVKRGQTACLTCLTGRLTRYWGDPQPPRQPAMLEHFRLTASLTAPQLQRFQRYGTCPELIERMWCIDLISLITRFDAVHRLPWCPQCFPGEATNGTGRIALPWA